MKNYMVRFKSNFFFCNSTIFRKQRSQSLKQQLTSYIKKYNKNEILENKMAE